MFLSSCECVIWHICADGSRGTSVVSPSQTKPRGHTRLLNADPLTLNEILNAMGYIVLNRESLVCVVVVVLVLVLAWCFWVGGV